MTAPLIHIGYPKCASTFLQNSVFPRSPDLFVGARWADTGFDRFVLSDDVDFDARSVAQEFSAPAGERHRTPVLSNENYVGGAAARVDWLVPTADRFARTFPDAKVIIIVREQRSMVLSLYRQLVKRGASLGLRDAITSAGAAGYYPRLRIERLRYHVAVQTYLERFGVDNVRVLAYEHLAHDSAAFVHDVISFGAGHDATLAPPRGQRENVGYRGLTLETRRQLNKASAENYNGPGGPHWSFRAAQRATLLADRFLPAAAHEAREAAYRTVVEDEVGDRFNESNRRLAELTGLDLAGLGYRVT